MKFGELLKRRRAQKMLSLRQVAAKAKLAPSTLSDLENGHSVDPSCSTVLRLSRVLKLGPSLMFDAVRESLEGATDAGTEGDAESDAE